MSSDPLQDFLDEVRDLPDLVGVDYAGVHTRGVLGDTPLHIATRRGNLRIIQLLLDAGADVDARGEYGHTPLHEAVGRGNLAAVQLLLQRGATRSIRNDWGQTAKEIAQLDGNHEIEVLVSEVT